MGRKGFALLTVLWVLAALIALVGVTLASIRVAGQVTRNRIWLARAEWAREACSAILQARYTQTGIVGLRDTVDLGNGLWCTVTDPVETAIPRAGTQSAGSSGPVNASGPLHRRSMVSTASPGQGVLGEPAPVVLTIVGALHPTPIVSYLVMTVAPQKGQLAIVRREAE